MTTPSSADRKTALRDWRSRVPEGIQPYFESAPLAAFFLGISSGFAFAMIGATLTTRLAQQGITKSAVTAFALTILAYNFKFIWAPIVDNVRLPLIGRFGQRRSWLWLVGVLVMVAVAFLGTADPKASLYVVAIAAVEAFRLSGVTVRLANCLSRSASCSINLDPSGTASAFMASNSR